MEDIISVYRDSPAVSYMKENPKLSAQKALLMVYKDWIPWPAKPTPHCTREEVFVLRSFVLMGKKRLGGIVTREDLRASTHPIVARLKRVLKRKKDQSRIPAFPVRVRLNERKGSIDFFFQTVQPR